MPPKKDDVDQSLTPEQLKALKNISVKNAQKQIIFSQLQQIYDLSNNLDSDSDAKDEFSIRVSEIASLRSRFEQVVIEIYQLELVCDPQRQFAGNEIDAFDQLYFRIKLVASRTGSDASASKNVNNNSSTAMNLQSQCRPRLPKIELFSFDGNIENFVTFYETFCSLVHNQDGISKIDKFHYLLSCTKGSALNLVRSVPISASNYDVVWQALLDKYQDHRMLVGKYLDKMLNFAPLSKESAANLNHFIEVFEHSFKAIQALNIENLSSYILCHVALRAHDHNTRKLFEQGLDQSTIPTYEQLIAHIHNHIKVLEHSASYASAPPQTQGRVKPTAPQVHKQSDVARKTYTQTNESKNSTHKADCLHLQLYRDPKDRFKKGQTKASLSLQHFLGFESGFTLDKESNTIAIICQDVIVVLAFETREQLIAWQVKVGGQLGSSKEFLVMIGGGGSRKLPAGPARLHLQGRKFALTSGVPPRLLGLWELSHLRRYGVVEGRFCFEGGSHCGKGEGLHVLITDQAQEITDTFDLAAQGKLPQQRQTLSRKSTGGNKRPDTRFSDIDTFDQSLPDTSSGLYEESFFGEDCGRTSPCWPSDERRFDAPDCTSTNDIKIGAKPPWSGADHITLERCNNCVTKLGAMARSSTVTLTTGTHFNPAWTMEVVPESSSDNSSNNSTEYLTPRAVRSFDSCQCKVHPPQRPPKPPHLDPKKPPVPLPLQSCTCSGNDNSHLINNVKVGPYENYDVPKVTHAEVDNAEYYDTPKRIKQALVDDLFQVTKNSSPDSLVLKKNCGCILKFGSKKKPVIVECEEILQPVECPCQKVTNWANNFISLPYCKRNTNTEKVNTQVLTSQKSDDMAIYATVDVSRKTNRKSDAIHNFESYPNACTLTDYENVEPKEENKFEGNYANYENLEFALSLEFYENAKDLLKKAGVTQNELDALSANIDVTADTLPRKNKPCKKCPCKSLPQVYQAETKRNKSDEYLLMEPSSETNIRHRVGSVAGYTPMSPNPNWSQSLKHPQHKLRRVELEKSLSIPTLNGSGIKAHSFDASLSSNNNREAMQKRSSSVDSARLLEDLKEFDSSVGSHAISSSMETLRNLALENRNVSPCDTERECCDHDCCKSSGSENKTSEESSSKEIPHLRNKHMDNAQIKRSSSVPCKSGGNRDSSSSNDSGVSSCSMKHGGGEFTEFEMPLTSSHSRYNNMLQKRMKGHVPGCTSTTPRKSKSSDPLRDMSMQVCDRNSTAKSSSAEAEVPVLPPRRFKGVMDTHSTSSGTSDMSDYIETLSLTSSQSSSDTQSNTRINRQPTNTMRPRSGKEYQNLDPVLTSMYKNGKDLANYTNMP